MSNLVSNGDVMVGWAIAIGLCVLGFLYWNATRQINNSKDILNTRGFPEKSRYPIITTETFAPLGVPISTTDAKRLYREVMVAIGYLDKGDTKRHVEYLAEAMKDRESDLRLALDDQKAYLQDTINDNKEQVRDLKKDLRAAKTDDERGVVTLEINDLESQILKYQGAIETEKAALESFKKDKRSFLVDYVNRELHGSEWSKKV